MLKEYDEITEKIRNPNKQIVVFDVIKNNISKWNLYCITCLMKVHKK